MLVSSCLPFSRLISSLPRASYGQQFFVSTISSPDDFLLVTLRFLPAVFDLLIGLRFAAFFREVFAGLRFLLAVFFAGISYSCRFEKNAQLYIDDADMEAFKLRFSTRWKSTAALWRNWSIVQLKTMPRSQEIRAFRRYCLFPGDNRFIASIALHYADSFSRWTNSTKCDSARSSLPASNHS